MLPYFVKYSRYEISVVFYGKLERVRPGAHVVMTLSGGGGGGEESPQDVRVIFYHPLNRRASAASAITVSGSMSDERNCN